MGFYVGILQTEFDIKKGKKIIVSSFVFVARDFFVLYAMFYYFSLLIFHLGVNNSNCSKVNV